MTSEVPSLTPRWVALVGYSLLVYLGLVLASAVVLDPVVAWFGGSVLNLDTSGGAASTLASLFVHLVLGAVLLLGFAYGWSALERRSLATPPAPETGIN